MKRLATAPHRLYFFLGALAIFCLFFWWWGQIQFAPSLAIPLHGLIMPLGVFPLFILGFTFTAGPRWISVDGPERYFLFFGSTYFSGLIAVIMANLFAMPALLSMGFALMLVTWLSVTIRWGLLLRKSKAIDKKHGMALLLAMCGGVAALTTTLYWSLGHSACWIVARQLSLYGFLLPVFLTVCHRMLPFFSNNVLKPYEMWRPDGLLAGWLIGCTVMTVSGSMGWSGVETFTACGLSISFAYTSWRWGLLRCLQNRMLAMLHLSFAWLTLVFALQAAAALGLNVGSAGIHALGLGFMGTMLVGFVTRVSYGHSGRPLQVANPMWLLYLGLHGAALLRIIASLSGIVWLVHASAALWLLLIACWIAAMIPVYLQARVDGQAG